MNTEANTEQALARRGSVNNQTNRAFSFMFSSLFANKISEQQTLTFLQAPDLAYTPEIEIFHCCNRKTPFASSDAPYRAEHYGVLRSRQLQRVVLQLQVKVWSALAGGHRVSPPYPPRGGMDCAAEQASIGWRRSPTAERGL